MRAVNVTELVVRMSWSLGVGRPEQTDPELSFAAKPKELFSVLAEACLFTMGLHCLDA